jgi:hypothetical protein
VDSRERGENKHNLQSNPREGAGKNTFIFLYNATPTPMAEGEPAQQGDTANQANTGDGPERAAAEPTQARHTESHFIKKKFEIPNPN